MIVDIYVREKNGSREIRVPWLPEEIDYKSGGAIVATYDIIDRGEVAVPTGSGLATVSWSSLFPGRNRTDKSMLRGYWKDPKTYHNILEEWKKNGTPLNILVTGYPINMDVFLEDYSGKAAGGFGDWEYEVTFAEKRDITITSTKVETPPAPAPQRPAQETTSYTIKSGDTLWSIAQRFLGSGTKWKEIYDANKDIIESTAKSRGFKSSDNGRWLFPGVKLTIPGSGSGSTSSSSTASNTATKSVDELAREVIQGKWGNGSARKERLTAAGYDYDAVQARVNQLLS